MEQDLTPSRRSVVTAGAAAALGVVGAGTLAACGGSGGSGTAATTPAAAPSATVSASGGATDPGGAVPEAALASLDDIPVGQALSVEGPSGTVIIAQPTAGEVVAFDARCTHQGCKVAVAGATLNCPCHGSKFETTTGKVLNGPATEDLAPVAVRVQGTAIVPA